MDVNWTELAQDRVSWWPLVMRLVNIYFCNSRTFPKQMSTAVTEGTKPTGYVKICLDYQKGHAQNDNVDVTMLSIYVEVNSS